MPTCEPDPSGRPLAHPEPHRPGRLGAPLGEPDEERYSKMISLLATLALLGGDGNPVVIVRDDQSAAKAPHQVIVHNPADDSTNSLGPPITSDLSWQKSAGGSPTWFVFPADVDGDDADEIIHVRHRPKKGDDIQVRAFYPPLFLDGKIGKPIGSSKKGTVGVGTGDGRVLLMTGGDFDGNGKDEAALIREFIDGSHRLEIRPLPKKKNKKMAKVIASDDTFGDAFTDSNRALMAADVDTDDVDEIVVVRRGADLIDRLWVFEPPQTVGGETGAAFASADDLDAGDGSEWISVSRVSLDPADPERLAVLRRDPILGTRLDIHPAPGFLDGTIGSPLFTDSGVATPTTVELPRIAFGLRGYHPTPPPLPPANISGVYDTQFQHTLAGGSVESIDGLPGIQGNQGGTQIAFLFPQFNQVIGSYSQANASLAFGAQVAEIDLTGQGITYQLNLGPASVTHQSGVTTLSGSYSGVKILPFNQQTVITGGVYVWKRS